MLRQKEENDKISNVDLAVTRAEAPYATQTMREIAQDYLGPPKYLNQRDAALEVPYECVKRLFEAVDIDMDDRLSLEEIQNYVEVTRIPIDEAIVSQMFHDAIAGRAYVNDEQRMKGLTIDEVCYAVRGRNSWDAATKRWNIRYPAFRKIWVLLLLTVNERIFAMQVPKVVPGKIVTQYEEQEALATLRAA